MELYAYSNDKIRKIIMRPLKKLIKHTNKYEQPSLSRQSCISLTFGEQYSNTATSNPK